MASPTPKTSTPPPAMNKKARAKYAKDTLNILIPHIITTNARAKASVSNSQLIRYDPSLVPKAPPRPPATAQPREVNAPQTQATRPRIKVIKSDTLDAAHSILTSNPTKKAKIAVLNMASPLRPGGGVLNGARAQEESLCLRSTLYATLHDIFYRLPELSAVYSADVLVFRAADNSELPKTDWFYVDVISCAALRFPETVIRGERAEEDGGPGAARGGMVYQNEGQREAMRCRVQTIVQAAVQNGVFHLVLGALGCGAYGNPPEEVAQIFKKVLCGDRKRPGVTVEESGIEEIVFAIFDEGENLRTFGEVFKDVSEC